LSDIERTEKLNKYRKMRLFLLN